MSEPTPTSSHTVKITPTFMGYRDKTVHLLVQTYRVASVPGDIVINRGETSRVQNRSMNKL